jgi:hypothetical protein
MPSSVWVDISSEENREPWCRGLVRQLCLCAVYVITNKISKPKEPPDDE